MAIGWYIAPFKRADGGFIPTRYCAMNDYTQQIIYTPPYGAWAESEILGNVAAVKVRTTQDLLDFLDTVPGFLRLPRDQLDDSLEGLTSTVLSSLRDSLLDAGYSVNEVQLGFLGGLEKYTLRDYLDFWAQRRLTPRYNPTDDTIYLDGEVAACRPIENVDEEVTE